jgi:hypothetical protein
MTAAASSRSFLHQQKPDTKVNGEQIAMVEIHSKTQPRRLLRVRSLSKLQLRMQGRPLETREFCRGLIAAGEMMYSDS